MRVKARMRKIPLKQETLASNLETLLRRLDLHSGLASEILSLQQSNYGEGGNVY